MDEHCHCNNDWMRIITIGSHGFWCHGTSWRVGEACLILMTSYWFLFNSFKLIFIFKILRIHIKIYFNLRFWMYYELNIPTICLTFLSTLCIIWLNSISWQGPLKIECRLKIGCPMKVECFWDDQLKWRFFWLGSSEDSSAFPKKNKRKRKSVQKHILYNMYNKLWGGMGRKGIYAWLSCISLCHSLT